MVGVNGNKVNTGVELRTLWVRGWVLGGGGGIRFRNWEKESFRRGGKHLEKM